MFIYKITNILDNKIYIGQTIRPIEDRFKRHILDAVNNVKDTHLARAIRKYGANNFTISEIDRATSQSELTEKEHYWINYYDSTSPENGYNETDAIYKCGGNTYASKTPTELECIAQKLSESKLGEKNPNSKRVKCLNVINGTEAFFNTVEECRKFFGENTHRFITTRTSEQTKGLYKGEWAIAYVGSEYKYETSVHKHGKTVSAINNKTGESHFFESIRHACRTLNIARNKVSEYIKSGNNEFVINDYCISIN